VFTWLKRLMLLYLIIAPLVTVIVLRGTDDPIRAHLRAFDTAKTQWDANPIRHYRVRAATAGHGYYCEQDLEVVDERVRYIHADSCDGYFALTVSYMFDQLESMLPRRVQWFGGYGCQVKVSRSEYHPEWGVPLKVLVTYEPMSDDTLGAFRHALIRARLGTGKATCSRVIPPFSTYVQVVSFTPLP
jgi:hypothetical protein